MMRDFATGLYPLSEPFKVGYLDVGEGHKIYYTQSGNKDGLPVIVFHGGPGSQSKPKHAQIFNPEKYHVIQFDQRGCGESLPSGELENNSTDRLLADAEKLREHLGFDKWHVYGSSWGSTLALLYAQTYTSVSDSLVISAVFLADKFSSKWMNGEGQNYIYPAEYEEFRSVVLKGGEGCTRQAVIDGLLNGGQARQVEVSNAFSKWHLCGMNMEASDFDPEMMEEEDVLAGVTMNRLFAHYDQNDFFIEEGQILRDMDKLKNVQGFVVQGRFDMCCPPKAAFDVSKAWHGGTLVEVQAASHSTGAPHFSQAIVNATDIIADRFSK
ncbi:MAG: prolyl aminopeptidase [Pseudomonadota bacterium]|nr:prolyl aminopeptidase [Pseudomonadota bacterium]